MEKYKKEYSQETKAVNWKKKRIIPVLSCVLIVIVLFSLAGCQEQGKQLYSGNIEVEESDVVYNSEYNTPPSLEVTPGELEVEVIQGESTANGEGPTVSIMTPPKERPVVPAVTQPEKVGIDLPYVIPSTDLQLQRVAEYEGVYLEDGSDTSVSNVAMLLLYNSGTEGIEYGKITMKYEDKILEFVVSAIPVDGKVVAQEINQNSCAAGELLECTADIATRAQLERAEGVIEITDNGDDSLTITNLSNQDIVTVRIFYKYYMEDENTYVGGITYTAKISDLKANESRVVAPSHYVSSGSMIMMVRTYDADA